MPKKKASKIYEEMLPLIDECHRLQESFYAHEETEKRKEEEKRALLKEAQGKQDGFRQTKRNF